MMVSAKPKTRQKARGIRTNNRPMRQPLIFAVLVTLLQLAFPVFSGTAIAILELDPLQSRIAQTIAFVFSGIVGLIIALTVFGSFRRVGLQGPHIWRTRNYLYFTPIMFVELISMSAGFENSLSPKQIAIYALFTLAVGFSEELYFRGLIARALRSLGVLQTIILSSLLFSLGHFFNLLAGASLGTTIMQVVFAFFFGIVAVELTLLTGSLLIPIVWHAMHNFISLITVRHSGNLNLFIDLMLGTVLLAYGLFLYRKLQRQQAVGRRVRQRSRRLAA